MWCFKYPAVVEMKVFIKESDLTCSFSSFSVLNVYASLYREKYLTKINQIPNFTAFMGSDGCSNSIIQSTL